METHLPARGLESRYSEPLEGGGPSDTNLQPCSHEGNRSYSTLRSRKERNTALVEESGETGKSRLSENSGAVDRGEHLLYEDA